MKTLLVTGGAGFIGSNFILHTLAHSQAHVICLDKLGYSANRANLASVEKDSRFQFIKGDIQDRSLLSALLKEKNPDAIIHFAAESHVDRSITSPSAFIENNVVGTFNLVDETRLWWNQLPPEKKKTFRFLHVSTDEVFGSLEAGDPPFHETTPYAPNSPYSASKASSDHVVRSYFHTYGMPTLITNCSNNYGPHQFPEKLIPLVILKALNNESIPVYGTGLNIRDWLYVTDHCEAIQIVLEQGEIGETYNIGGQCEKSNLEVVKSICALLDHLKPQKTKRESLITFVTDRLGHDKRYAMDITKIKTQLGWSPRESFETGLQKTVRWYLDHLNHF